MPEFTRFQPGKKFLLRGINCTRPLDALPDGKVPWCKNVRSYVEGEVITRPGLTNLFSFAIFPGAQFLHGIYTLNNFQGTGPAIRLYGYNTRMMNSDVGIPPASVHQNDLGWSGSPRSWIGCSPIDSGSAWVYVYDTTVQKKYCSAYPGFSPYIAEQIGMLQPQTGTPGWVRPVITRVAGTLTGNYFYRFQLRDQKTGARSCAGVPTWPGSPVILAGQYAQMAMPFIPDAASIGPGATGFFTVDIYRFGGAVLDWRLIGSAPSDGATVFTDKLSDIAVQSAQSLNQNVFQPWITEASPFLNTTGSVTAATAGTPGLGNGTGSIITLAGPPFIPLGGAAGQYQWLPGTPIIVNDSIPATLLRFIDTNHIEVTEDLGAIAGPVKVTVTGALQCGTPLPFVWGPYGSGFFGLYIFACGDPNRPGTVYWTNGNDPDSTQPANSLDLSDPSEPLQNGCIYNGQIYVWSTERMWVGYPDLANPGNFNFQVIPGARGLFANWCFCVGDYIYWKSKDGIYRTAGGLPESLTDADLYSFFPHEALPGGLSVPNPDNPAVALQLPPADPNHPEYERLSWSSDQGLRYDYVDTNGRGQTLIYHKFPSVDGTTYYGWIYDAYEVGLTSPRYAYWEDSVGPTLTTTTYRELIAIGPQVYEFTSADNTDNGNLIHAQLMLPANDLGDSRALKLIGDVWINALIGVNNPSQYPSVLLVGNYNTGVPNILATGTIPNSANFIRSSTILDVTSGEGTLQTTVSLWITWTLAASTVVQLFEYNYSWILKPEVTNARYTDWTDDGYVGSKLLKGIVIEANTFTVNKGFSVQIQTEGSGNVSLGPFTINTGNQIAQAYALSGPVIGHQFRISPNDTVPWELFTVMYIWDKYPESIAQYEDYTPDKFDGFKYVRGVVLEGDTSNSAFGSLNAPGATINFQLQYDGGAVLSIPGISQSGKTLTYVGFANPILASEIRIIPLGPWRRFPGTRFIFDEYPDYCALITPWSFEGGGGRRRYIRGGVLHANTQGLGVTVQLQGDNGTPLTTVALSLSGQSVQPFAIVPPVISHLTRWVPLSGGQWMYWPDTVWDQEIYPELLAEMSPVMEVNGGDAAFIQGFKIVGDSSGIQVSIQVLYDGGTVGPTLTGTWTGKSVQVFPATDAMLPFIAHTVQFKPLGAISGFWGECKIISEPVPDLATVWQTQQTDHDIPGWHSLRDSYIAYQSAPGATLPENFVITTEYGSASYSLPVSTNYTRLYVPLAPQKAKWRRYSVFSERGVRLFVKDIAVRAKGWNASNVVTFNPFQPIGDFSRAVGARI